MSKGAPHDHSALLTQAEQRPPDRLARSLHLALAAVIGMAFVGFFVGIRQGAPSPDTRTIEHVAAASQTAAIPATAYRDFDRRRLGPNKDWTSTLVDLKQPEIDLFSKPQTSEEARREVLAARSRRRAFEGAPPVVPHAIDQRTTASCLVCHGDNVAIGMSSQQVVRATKMSHHVLANCTQCHVEQHAAELETLEQPANLFAGNPAPLSGDRAWNGAPPTVPHTTLMRETCLSCHGPTGADPIRTTHAWRTNCLQCHAPSAVLDQWSFDSIASPL
jgi:cytochrome c-type protein NapB